MTFQPSKMQESSVALSLLGGSRDYLAVRRLPCETSWRRTEEVGVGALAGLDITASRWVDDRTCLRRFEAETPRNRHVVAIAMRGTNIRLSSGSRTVCEGKMPAGTIHVAAPGAMLRAEFSAPCDFIHLSVATDCFRRRAEGATGDLESPDMSDFMTRDVLVEQMARSLIESGGCYDEFYAESIGHAIVMRLLGRRLPEPGTAPSRVAPLPRWRLRRVQAHVDQHIDETVTLADLASAAGLSRMHFAAQFRAATGHRPHEYLLLCRIERAKAILSSETMPLAEVALSVGFQAQAHFTTVFKRVTGETPARWRRMRTDASGPVAAGSSP